MRIIDTAPSNFILLIVPMRYFLCGSICFMYQSRIVLLFEPPARFHSFSYVLVNAHSAYDMFT